MVETSKSTSDLLDSAHMKAPMSDPDGKVAFVTGGASGIGLGIVQAFLDAGMKIAVGDRSREHLDEAMKCLAGNADRVHPIFVDVTDRQAVENAAAETVRVFGRVHVLVNNAGVQNPSSLANMSYEEWDTLMGVNLGGVFNGVHAFLPRIKQHGEGGHIITTGSVAGLFATGNFGAYCVSKFAAVAMSESLRADLAESNIGVSVLCPGMVKTNLDKELLHHELASEPLEIGHLVLRGMKNNDLYILTHPEFNPLIQCRNDAIMAATPKDLYPSDGRNALAQSLLQRSVYLKERTRHSQ